MEGSFGRVHLNGKLIALQYVTELSLVQAELKRELGDSYRGTITHRCITNLNFIYVLGARCENICCLKQTARNNASGDIPFALHANQQLIIISKRRG